MKILIVYYSLTGNTKFIAEIIKNALNADILPLKPKKELNPEGGMKFFWGGYQAIMKKKPKLEDFDINPEEYDLIFIGTPVWAWRYSPPIRSFLKQFNLKNKKVAIWMCYAGNADKALMRFKETIADSVLLGENKFQDPLQKGPEEAKKRAIQWVNQIVETVKEN